MTLTEAVKMLEEIYNLSKQQQWIINPLAYALHQVWKKADKKRGKPKHKEEISFVELIGKNASKKPIEKFPFDMCPVCDTVVLEHMKHCTQCGQKLDWSDKE